MLELRTIDELENELSEPPPALVQGMRSWEGDLLVLGVAGKMGPSLARMARRASEMAGIRRRIIGVARFSSPAAMNDLERQGIEVRRCDLSAEHALTELPNAPNVLFLAGMKFGSTGQEPLTWAMNSYLPAIVAQRFPHSRIVALSTGNVYGLVPTSGPGSLESDTPAPVGEYAMSCLGRERMFQYFSALNQTPIVLVRLNYACDLRYGVLVDLAQKILAGVSVDLGMSWFNTLWQADANAMILRSFEHVTSPPKIINVTGPELLNVREVCLELGRLLGRRPIFSGAESSTALLSNAKFAFDLFGKPRVTAGELLAMVVGWVRRGGLTLNKPTHFECRDGHF